MRRERVGHTLQMTALVHEAYLRNRQGSPDRIVVVVVGDGAKVRNGLDALGAASIGRRNVKATG